MFFTAEKVENVKETEATKGFWLDENATKF
jgi:hypothetical protein